VTPLRVAVNGYGVIGKRVADAVAAQPDMELAGVSSVTSDYRIRVALRRGYAVYRALPDEHNHHESMDWRGTLDDLLAEVDVVVDCTPAKVGAANLGRYQSAGVKAIFQGGEAHNLTGHSFVASESYTSALGRDCTRVVSCNTTATVRTLSALRNAGLLKKARGVLIRRATDPWESNRSGIMNTLVPDRKIPSHQGPDAQAVAPDLDVVTMAANASHTQGHSHFWTVELTRDAEREEVLAAFRADSRIAFIRSQDGLVALNTTQELMRDLGRPRGDMYEVALWEDGLEVQGRELYYTCQVDNQAIVIPETIDAVRALAGSLPDANTSICRTNEALGVQQDFLSQEVLQRCET
jgi:glyceraldehyde-3-phosphate dehydrogenase (NAD(P))